MDKDPELKLNDYLRGIVLRAEPAREPRYLPIPKR